MATQSHAAGPIASWGRIDIERIGGLAGYGLPGAGIRSRGYVLADQLTPADQARLHQLFLQPQQIPPRERDAFRYHLTRQSTAGPITVVAAETMVPEVVRDSVHDELVPYASAPATPRPAATPVSASTPPTDNPPQPARRCTP